MEDILKRYIVPELESHDLLLRARACKVCDDFAERPFHDNHLIQTLMHLISLNMDQK